MSNLKKYLNNLLVFYAEYFKHPPFLFCVFRIGKHPL